MDRIREVREMEQHALDSIDSRKNGNTNPDREKPVFITDSPVMLDLYNKIKLIAGTHVTVLITGENGTGKEVVAKLLHYHGTRTNKPIITVNCGAIPSELVESELFGHEKGAFTGAVSREIGCFEMADKGTLFLDEIGEMSLNAQVKLLRAVELGSFRRVGGKEEINVDLTLISATNKILSDRVKSGSFREDLYYRLNVVELYVPPLRHRKEDIPLLIDFYSNKYSNMYDNENIHFDSECHKLFNTYDWPGNIRELKNIVERCVVLYEGNEITTNMLPDSITKSAPEFPESSNGSSNGYLHIRVGTPLDEIERLAIHKTLDSVDNNKTEAAKILGFARKTLHNKLDKYENGSLV